ncbi:MAG: hypothetical protein RML36_12345 [Anaerolineae bacterium]|nr:hypothetical protein [Anaerolineae bacterium]MDW8100261.1 hypothetical protein [Anaerolineae bacterium]
MKPFSIMWSEGITEEEATQAVLTVQEIVTSAFRIEKWKRVSPLMPEIRPFGTWVIPAVPRGAAYWGTQWYIERSLDPKLKRVRGYDFLRLVQFEPWQFQAPHFDLALLDHELIGDPDDAPETLTLGLTLPGTATVISVAPLRAIRNRSRRLAALRRLIAHHLGHMVRVPRPGRTKSVDTSGPEPHCTAVCAMRHAENIFELLKLTREEAEAGVTYCDECQRDLRVQLVSAQFSLN